jgi:hypothetical protein
MPHARSFLCTRSCARALFRLCGHGRRWHVTRPQRPHWATRRSVSAGSLVLRSLLWPFVPQLSSCTYARADPLPRLEASGAPRTTFLCSRRSEAVPILGEGQNNCSAPYTGCMRHAPPVNWRRALAASGRLSVRAAITQERCHRPRQATTPSAKVRLRTIYRRRHAGRISAWRHAPARHERR